MATWLLGSTPLDDLPFDDAGRRANTAVDRGFDAVKRRQTGQVALDQRLHGLHVEAPDEHEREVAGVGESVLVERHRSVEIHLIDRCGRQRTRPRMVLRQRGDERVAKRRFRPRLLVGEHRSQTRLQRLELRPDRRRGAVNVR